MQVGVIGTGWMARTHAKCVLRAGGAVAGVVSRSAENGAKFAAEFGGQAFPSLDAMLAEVRPDAAYVCLPPGAHRGEVEQLAGLGVHLFLEKPIALTVPAATGMTDAVTRAGVVCQVGYQARFGTAVRRLKAMLADGTAGTPTLLTGRYFCNALHAPWWRDRAMGGGQTLEQAIHLYDMALHLLGQPAAAAGHVANLLHQHVDNYSVEDTAAALVRFRSGAAASLCSSNCAVPTQWACTWTVVCQNVVAEFADPNNATFTFTHGRTSEQIWAGAAAPATEQHEQATDLYADATENFFAAIRGEQAVIAPIAEALLGLRLADAVVRSSTAGGQIQELS